MEKDTYYTKATTSDDDANDIYHARIYIPPEEVARLLAARDLLVKVQAENPGLAIESLKLASDAGFGRLELEDEAMMSEIDEGDDLMPGEDGWWPEMWTQLPVGANRILISPGSVEWQAVCEDTGVHAWTEASWAYFEVFALRYGIVELKATADAKYLAAGIIKKGDVPSLAILADALDEAGNEPWVGNRLRESVKDFGSDADNLELADRIVYGSALRKLSGGATKPKTRKPRG